MGDRAEIQALYTTLMRDGGAGVLATVVHTSGSTYRRPGARMLLASDGASAGVVSGGCLDGDLRERSAAVLETGKPSLVTYDSTMPDDILWGLGLGCSGVALILLERVGAGRKCSVLEFIGLCGRLDVTGSIATVYRMTGEPDARIGARVMVCGEREMSDEIGDQGLAEQMRAACVEAVGSERSRHMRCALPRGDAEVFVEFIPSAPSLFVFGAGPDAVPLVRIAKALGWRVTVVDGRSASLTRQAFPEADDLLLVRPEETHSVRVPDGSAAVVMTHNANHDTAIVKALLESQACYIGLLGPKSRSKQILDRLRCEGFAPSDREISRLFNPMGLDIGAETPEEIALAAAAEIQSVFRDRPGASLRLREGPIHT
jgi:xanthine/CO dehydrogenase XdhC/CoxF family maturation factor